MSFPSLPSSVDQYVREILNRMMGRTGKAGDQVVFRSELAELKLAQENGNALSQPARANSAITDSLKPVEGLDIPDKPTTPRNLSATGSFGAVTLQWTPAVYKKHLHTEVWRAQTDDRDQASLVNKAKGNLYVDVTGSAVRHYYWIRHVNSSGHLSGFNALEGVSGKPTEDTTLVTEQVKGVIDDSYFTADWAEETRQHKASVAQVQSDISTIEQTVTEEDSSLSSRLDTITAQNRIGSAAYKIEVMARAENDQVLVQKTESLESTVGDSQASITEQQTITDALKAEYTLKVRQETNGQVTVAGIGVASGQSEDGEPFSEIAFAAENFFFTTPNGLKRPLSIVNVGSGADPDYRVAIDAGVQINGTYEHQSATVRRTGKRCVTDSGARLC